MKEFDAKMKKIAKPKSRTYSLQTERLNLRAPQVADVESITAQIGDFEVAKNLSSVPHPYSEADAHYFLGITAQAQSKGTGYNFAILRGDTLIGVCGVYIKEGKTFEIGYWLGRSHWGQGYATEAARELVSFTFRELDADKITAVWFEDNPPSGHVLTKIGFQPVGVEKRQCVSRGHEVVCNLVSLTR